MRKNILILKGDGIGPEVIKQAVKIISKVGTMFNHSFELIEGLIGHAAIEKTGEPLPDKTLEQAKDSDAILLGAVGHPKYGPNDKIRPEQGLLKIRKELNLFCNIRPIKLFDALLDASPIKTTILKGTDIIFFRELTGGIYFGEPRERRNNDDTAVDTMVYSKKEIERIAKKAFEVAMTRKKKVCSVDKANVLECSRLWRETVEEVAKNYPEVELTHEYIDAAAMKLIQEPKNFDVVVTGNMFGDILTDEASQITGSMGMLASASTSEKTGLFEPIHGSAPDIAEQNKANPLAAILSVAMMMDLSFGLKKEASMIEKAIDKVLKDGFRTFDIKDENTPAGKVLGTIEMGDEVERRIESR